MKQIGEALNILVKISLILIVHSIFQSFAKNLKTFIIQSFCSIANHFATPRSRVYAEIRGMYAHTHGWCAPQNVNAAPHFHFATHRNHFAAPHFHRYGDTSYRFARTNHFAALHFGFAGGHFDFAVGQNHS